jgi:hypothetical protein
MEKLIALAIVTGAVDVTGDAGDVMHVAEVV